MPQEAIVLANSSQTAVLLDAARGIIQGQLERQLRQVAGEKPFGRVGKIERKSGMWPINDVLAVHLKKIGAISPDLAKKFRTAFTHPSANSQNHRLCSSGKWFVVDFLWQPVFDDDDCGSLGAVEQ